MLVDHNRLVSILSTRDVLKNFAMALTPAQSKIANGYELKNNSFLIFFYFKSPAHMLKPFEETSLSSSFKLLLRLLLRNTWVLLLKGNIFHALRHLVRKFCDLNSFRQRRDKSQGLLKSKSYKKNHQSHSTYVKVKEIVLSESSDESLAWEARKIRN